MSSSVITYAYCNTYIFENNQLDKKRTALNLLCIWWLLVCSMETLTALLWVSSETAHYS